MGCETNSDLRVKRGKLVELEAQRRIEAPSINDDAEAMKSSVTRMIKETAGKNNKRIRNIHQSYHLISPKRKKLEYAN